MKPSVVIIGIVSAGLVIGGTVWYFHDRKPKKSSEESGGEDIPDTNEQSGSQTNETKPSGGSSHTTQKPKSTTATATTQESPILTSLKSKLGAGARIKNNQVFVVFNKNQNLATFYSNNRFAIFKIGQESKGALMKGSFKNDGFTLIPDKGKEISSNSVWGNLERLPFKK